MATKKKIKSKVDGVMNVADNFVDIAANFINQRYKISKRVGDAKKEIFKFLYLVKKVFFRTLVEGLLLVTGLLALIIGLIILISKHYPLEYVLIIYGVIVLIFVLMRMKMDL
ncbi:hypothetical protein HON01_12445 [Candidatus Woesearchaeota archaeon]|nr:hypothetical protein [Candidatus Woesearchaeota archaeon]MBT7367917.1 hypothetical protein [Candidatus Woesearchaeota archaeon]